jgi:hypothetical protein
MHVRIWEGGGFAPPFIGSNAKRYMEGCERMCVHVMVKE